MTSLLNDQQPIFSQIREWIGDQIINGTFRTHDRIPSTNEIVHIYKVNHLTVAKGVNELVDDGLLYKRRGLGVFVADEAREMLLDKRRADFIGQYMQPMLEEAAKLGFDAAEIERMMQKMEGVASIEQHGPLN